MKAMYVLKVGLCLGKESTEVKHFREYLISVYTEQFLTGA